jgi:hypothetical protein
MSTSPTVQRLAAVLFLLAALLLLKKPVFGETESLLHTPAAVQTTTSFQTDSLSSFTSAKTNLR